MTQRIAIVGSNGRLGTELALRLAGTPGIEVIGICRNRAGSAYLRLQGVECRHGQIADNSAARHLLADCRVVVQLAYRAPRSRAGAAVNRAVVRNSVVCAPSGAHVLTASTIMVYGPDASGHVPDAYGLEKLLLERVARRWGHRTQRPVTVMRIGHALGPLQPQSQEIIESIRTGPVALANEGRNASNTVLVAALAEAVHLAASGDLPVGTFDALSWPQWTWADVYRFHAEESGLEHRLSAAERHRDEPRTGKLRGAFRSRSRGLLLVIPEGASERAYGAYLRKKATQPAHWSTGAGAVPTATNWRAVGRKPLPVLSDPRTALQMYPIAERSIDELPGAWSIYSTPGGLADSL